MVMGNLAGTGEALDSSLNTIYSAFMVRRDETGVFRSCATRSNLKPHEGRSKNINTYGRFIAYDLSDGVDMAQSQQLSDTTTTFTVFRCSSLVRRCDESQTLTSSNAWVGWRAKHTT